MQITVKEALGLLGTFKPDELIQFWFRLKPDYEHPSTGDPLDDLVWDEVEDWQGDIDDFIDEKLRECIEFVLEEEGSDNDQ